MSEALVEVRNLAKYFTLENDFFGRPTSVLKAVDDVSFEIKKGEAFGLVGESGCGKTTIGKMLVNLYRPTKGEIIFEGEDLTALSEQKRREFCKDIQLIFQDPYASLNPRMTVGDIIAEPIKINKLLPKDKIEERVTYLLNCVGLANHHRNRYPYEFSGGQRQRVGIARALVLEPQLVICDEPISALDVSIQAQVVNMLMKFQRELGLTYLFIAHDLSMVRHIADETAVMYLGTMVEYGPTEEVYGHPAHPYTQGLLSAVPVADPDYEKTHHRIPMEGEVPSPIDPKPGCRFCGRCPRATEQCRTQTPAPKDLSGGHFAACHHLD